MEEEHFNYDWDEFIPKDKSEVFFDEEEIDEETLIDMDVVSFLYSQVIRPSLESTMTLDELRYILYPSSENSIEESVLLESLKRLGFKCGSGIDGIMQVYCIREERKPYNKGTDIMSEELPEELRSSFKDE